MCCDPLVTRITSLCTTQFAALRKFYTFEGLFIRGGAGAGGGGGGGLNIERAYWCN